MKPLPPVSLRVDGGVGVDGGAVLGGLCRVAKGSRGSGRTAVRLAALGAGGGGGTGLGVGGAYLRAAAVRVGSLADGNVWGGVVGGKRPREEGLERLVLEEGGGG
eukprot:1932262-Pleurochrysis_carterae.AAC.1